MARRVVKIPRVKSIEQAREILLQMTPENRQLTIFVHFNDRRLGGSLMSHTHYSASIDLRSGVGELKVEAHCPDNLVRKFVEIILPALNAKPVDPEEGRIGRHRRVQGKTVPRLEYTPERTGGLFDGQ